MELPGWEEQHDKNEEVADIKADREKRYTQYKSEQRAVEI